jgi:hypothetical protein
MDGESLWAIRKNGWLELGFNKIYFENTMRRYGWWLETHVGQDSPWATALIARRLVELTRSWDYLSGDLKSTVGTLCGPRIMADGRAGYLMYGPYVSRPRGAYTAYVRLHPTGSTRGRIQIDVTADFGRRQLAFTDVELIAGQTAIALPVTMETDVAALEIRVFCEDSTHVTLEGAKLEWSETVRISV